MNLELANSDRLAGWQTLGFSCQELWGSTHLWAFPWVLEIHSPVLMLPWRATRPLNHLPNQEYFFRKVHVDREVGNLSNMVKIMIYRKCFDNVDIV